MKIVFINTKDNSGGAGIAAWRIAKGLKEYCNTKNYFIVGQKTSNAKNVLPVKSSKLITFIERIINKLTNILGLQYFCIPFSSYTILKKIKEINPDIIHIHNTHGGYFNLDLLPKLEKLAPIIWTFHDMWPFTSNASYTFEDNSWKELKCGINEKNLYPKVGLTWGNLLIKRKQKIYKKTNFTITTPSLWLKKEAEQSPTLEEKFIKHIFNGLDLTVYKPLNQIECRKELSIPDNAFVLMFAAEFLSNKRKGADLFWDILISVQSKLKQPLHLIALGHGHLPQVKNLNIYNLGHIDDQKKLVKTINAADLFLYPTKADNLPNSLVESIACGTPCITFDIGGCNEIIKNNNCGFVVPAFDIELFANKVVYLFKNKARLNELSNLSRIYAEKHFDIKNITKQYYELCKKSLDI